MALKKLLPFLFLILCACGGAPDDNALTLELRSDFLHRTGCSGAVSLTADYGDRVYDYAVNFSEKTGEGMKLLITAPQEIAGISATIADGETGLQFDGVQLETGPITDTGLSPLDALPALLTAVESGYIAETGTEMLGETETLRICCRETGRPAGDGVETILWFDKSQKTLLSGEIRQDGYTVIRCRFSSFVLINPTN